jgi:hypothetical protein
VAHAGVSLTPMERIAHRWYCLTQSVGIVTCRRASADARRDITHEDAIGSAQGREPRSGRTPSPEHLGEHLVGLTASRCGLTRFWQPRAMEFTWGLPSVMRPVTDSAGPTRAGAIAVPGASPASAYCRQAVDLVSWPPPGTRRP